FQDLYMTEVFRRLTPTETPVVEAATRVSKAALETKAAGFKHIGKTQDLLRQHADKINQLVTELRPLIAKTQGREVPNDQLSGLSEAKKVCLRPSIYQLRYRMIQADQNAQSAI